MSRVEELKRVGNLTMTDLVHLGKVAIGPGFGDRLREAYEEQNGTGPSNGAGSGAGSLVLVADGDPDILTLLRLVLEEEGHEVIEASDGDEAAMMTLERRPDLCVLDTTMSGIDGIRVTRLLRAADQTRDVPIVLLSTRPGAEGREAASKAGASEYVTKPFVPDDLQRAVRELLRGQSAKPRASKPHVTGRLS